MREKPIFGDRRDVGRRPDHADPAETQISGKTPPGDLSSRTVAGSEPAGREPFDRPSPRFGPPPAAPPPTAESADETVFMDVDVVPKIPLAWLAVVDGPGGTRGKVVTLSSETVVGRTQGDLLLSGDRGISSQHLRVRLEPKEGSEADELLFVAYDQATTNGTYIGSCSTYRQESCRVYRRELHDGDFLLLGETTLVFKQVDEPPAEGGDGPAATRGRPR